MGYGDVEHDVGGVPALPILTVKLSLSFADESRGHSGWLPGHLRDGASRTETRWPSLFRIFRWLLPGLLVISVTMVTNNIKAFVPHTKPRNVGVHPLPYITVTPS